MATRSIGVVDTMWLRMDRPENLMTIDGVMWTDEPVDWDRFLAVVERRVLRRYPVFSQRPVMTSAPLGLARWEDDPNFDLGRHVIRVRLPHPGGEKELQRYIEEQVSRPFDKHHPLWEMHLVDGMNSGAAVVSRFHHSLADGIALAHVMLSLTDPTRDADLEEAQAARSRGTRRRATAGSVAGSLVTALPLVGPAVDVTAKAVRTAVGATTGALEKVPALLTPSGMMAAATTGWQTAKILTKLLLHMEPESPLHAPIGTAKRAVWSRPLPVEEVKRIGRATGTTVNDVLMAALAGAIYRYSADRRAEPVDLMTMVPVNLRPLDKPLPRELGNRFALVLLSLPTGAADRARRLAETKRRMDEIKNSPERVVTLLVSQLIGVTTTTMEKALVDFFASKAFGVTTNVIGPTHQRYVAGTPLVGALGWVPGSGQQTLGTCIFSYAGTVRVGFKADARAVKRPEMLVRYFEDELAEFLAVTEPSGSRANGEVVPLADRSRKSDSRDRRGARGRARTNP